MNGVFHPLISAPKAATKVEGDVGKKNLPAVNHVQTETNFTEAGVSHS
jgi:hypothetical protein